MLRQKQVDKGDLRNAFESCRKGESIKETLGNSLMLRRTHFDKNDLRNALERCREGESIKETLGTFSNVMVKANR